MQAEAFTIKTPAAQPQVSGRTGRRLQWWPHRRKFRLRARPFGILGTRLQRLATLASGLLPPEAGSNLYELTPAECAKLGVVPLPGSTRSVTVIVAALADSASIAASPATPVRTHESAFTRHLFMSPPLAV